MERVYSVREVSSILRELLDSSSALGNLWVSGEVSNVSRPASGHTYFTLKDSNAQLKAVFFAPRYVRTSTAALIEHGRAVVAHGRVALYEARGDVQLIVDFVQPEGAGALQLEFERLRARLEEEGLFDPARKRPLPPFPHRVGIVTSESGAVFHDICRVIERRWPLAEIVLAPAPVQGADAPSGIVGALRQLERRGDIDVIIAGRGGGSIEELWAFNDEHVARAIFACHVPVVSAVGHETDVTIADYVADRRAPTPSAAAELVTPDGRQVLASVALAAGSLGVALGDRLATFRARLTSMASTIERREPGVDPLRERVHDTLARAERAADSMRDKASHEVGTCIWRLKALDPFATLDRGYAIVQRGTHVIASVGDPRPGERLGVRVADGSFDVRVGGAAPVLRKRARRHVHDAQAPLFMMPEERA